MLKIKRRLNSAWKFCSELFTSYYIDRSQIEKYLSQSGSHAELEYRQKELMRRGII